LPIDRGVFISGSGIGASIACNKFSGIRAALITNFYTAGMCRKVVDPILFEKTYLFSIMMRI